MPELPEVETIRRQLAGKIIGKKLEGKKITGVRRRAKVLMIDFSDGSSLIFHFKLTGQLIFNGEPSKHTRHIFKFGDGSRLIFNDARKFGWWKELKNTQDLEMSFGPEALEISGKEFQSRLQKRPNAKIKPLLMDQKFIAGIGNIYSDEILFAAKVHPLRRVKTLNDKEIKLIHQNIKKILTRAIQRRGTTEQSYRDAYGRAGEYAKHLEVYRREGEKCYRCGGKIKRLKIRGRSAHYCPNCQSL
ncbi:MAG: DNA-formamidopyrimidine glycosylase [Candidatus Nealsonbacteria bacterium]|nr:DNA-formamidopyrimidine glycosylase [Candidatus Nealsonbacteria bacterium]